MKIKTAYFDIEIETLLFIVSLVSIFSVTFRETMKYYYLCYLFIIFHELSHVFIGSLLGKRVEKFSLCVSGVNAKFEDERYNLIKNTNYLYEIFMYTAGPISNLILALIFSTIPLIFEINIFLCLVNLIPIFPLDGYNIIRCILSIKKSAINIDIIEKIVIIIFATFVVFQVIFLKNIALLIFSLYLIIIYQKSRNIKKYDRI